MTRAITVDFETLIAYLDKYSLSTIATDPDFLGAARGVHKRYLSLLTLVIEIEDRVAAESGVGSKHRKVAFAYFKESASDVGSAIHCWIQGTYKPSRMMLRSAIETLAKGLAASESLAVLKTKSVFSVLDDAKKVAMFSDPVAALLASQMENLYAELCKDVHTASKQNMAHMTALNTLPNFSKIKAKEEADLITKVIKNILSIQCLFFKDYFNSIHFKNREVVRECLGKDVLRKLAGIT